MIIYLHGFRSSPDSFKSRQLKSRLKLQGLEHRFWCEALPVGPLEAIHRVETVIHSADSHPLLIGSSLGGYYATYLAERHDIPAILINPAVSAFDVLAPWVGQHTNLYTGEPFELTSQHIEELRTLWVPVLKCPERYWLMVETGDEVLDPREAVERYQGCRQTVVEGGDHSFQHFPEMIDEIIRMDQRDAAPPWSLT